MVNDPVADLVVRLKNAAAIGKSSVSVPFSNFKYAIAETLKNAGYVKAVEKKGKKVKKMLDITLTYNEGKPAISGVKRISKPGRRVYRGARELFSVRYGHGALILSTPKGVLTNVDARKQKVGGEALFEVW
ncbi:30S ribosomal protein S8 [Candidatus Kaiserbacteria bacterium]|nr:30S ribosomal protein S8 [Candidatus Kaiserbacteria bacterium]